MAGCRFHHGSMEHLLFLDRRSWVNYRFRFGYSFTSVPFWDMINKLTARIWEQR